MLIAAPPVHEQDGVSKNCRRAQKKDGGEEQTSSSVKYVFSQVALSSAPSMPFSQYDNL